MKIQFAGRVIGHELVEGDKPKSDGDSLKVKLAIRRLTDVPGKSSTATLLLAEEEALRDFPLKRVLLITCEESQRDLFAALHEAEDEAEGKGRRAAANPNQRTLGLVPPGIPKPPDGEGPIGGPRGGGRRRGRAGAPVH